MSAIAYLSGELNKGSELTQHYWSYWPKDSDRADLTVARHGSALLSRWFRDHQLRSVLCDGLLSANEVVDVSYHGVKVSAHLDLAWRRGDAVERVLFFLDPLVEPAGNLLVNHIWHHTMLSGQKSDILLYNFTENCYSRLEAINPALYSQSLRAARDLLERNAKHPTYSGCEGCNVSRRCLHDEIVL